MNALTRCRKEVIRSDTVIHRAVDERKKKKLTCAVTALTCKHAIIQEAFANAIASKELKQKKLIKSSSVCAASFVKCRTFNDCSTMLILSYFSDTRTNSRSTASHYYLWVFNINTLRLFECCIKRRKLYSCHVPGLPNSRAFTANLKQCCLLKNSSHKLTLHLSYAYCDVAIHYMK